MIRPVAFHSNPETAASNSFQRDPELADPDAEQAAAEVEFQGVVDMLMEAGVRVVQENDTRTPSTPDSVFPNNWISTHADGRVVVYPMMAPSRRSELRPDIVERLSAVHGFRVGEVVDLSAWAERGLYLEGTGSMVLDRPNRLAYACLSPRTDLEVLADFCQRLGYEAVAFESVDGDGVPVYHTNVMMCLGEGFAVICDESIPDAAQRRAVLGKLEAAGHELVRLDLAQMEQFAGNMLELESMAGEKLLAMSARAELALTDAQRETLARHARIVSAPVGNIEDSAGGSIRCMLAELHLPRR